MDSSTICAIFSTRTGMYVHTVFKKNFFSMENVFIFVTTFELRYPSESNPYLFNGDFVDRGSFSLENVLTLFCWKLVYPQHVHLLRGNHETVNMNKMYGFEGEVC